MNRTTLSTADSMELLNSGMFRAAFRRFLRLVALVAPMSESSSSRIQPITKPPACPKCHTGANVALEGEAGTRQMWTCTACGVRWEVRLTPRTER